MHLTLSLAGYGRHAAAWRVSSLAGHSGALPRYDALVGQAQAALFDSVFLTSCSGADASALKPDTLPMLGSLVARTSHIGLGATVDIAHTEPFHTARAFAVLDNLSSGRTAWLLDLTVPAAGDPDFAHRTALDAEAHYARAEEYIGVAMRLWDSWEQDAVVVDKAAGIFANDSKIHPIHHRGTHFTVRGPLTAVRPVQGHPVVVVGDMSPAGQRIAARFADVFVASCASIDEALSLAKALRAQAAAHGRSPQALRILIDLMPVLAETDAAARDRESTLDSLLEPQAPRNDTLRFVGTPQGCADLMAAWHAAGACDGFNLAPAVLPEDIGSLTDGLVPLLQKRGLFRSGYSAATLRDHLGLPMPVNSFSAESVR